MTPILVFRNEADISHWVNIFISYTMHWNLYGTSVTGAQNHLSHDQCNAGADNDIFFASTLSLEMILAKSQ